MCVEVSRDTIIDCVAILLGDYSNIRKKASLLILKAAYSPKFVKFLLEDERLYPISRNDSRVRMWTKKVLSKGKCETCGSENDLEAHHIISWAEYPQGRIDVKNGICLCHECHTEEHKDDLVYYMMKSKNKLY